MTSGTPCLCHGWTVTLSATRLSPRARVRIFRALTDAPLIIRVGAALGVPVHTETGEARARAWEDRARREGWRARVTRA